MLAHLDEFNQAGAEGSLPQNLQIANNDQLNSQEEQKAELMMEIPEASEDEEEGAEVEQKLERRVIGKVDFSDYKDELLDVLFEVKKVRAKMKTLKK